jgi:hypothetical protein
MFPSTANMEVKMLLRYLVFVGFSMLAANVYGEVFDTIRQQFEIYSRFSGEIEILSTDDTREIDNVLVRIETKQQAVRKKLDKLDEIRPPKRNLPSPLFAEDFAAPFIHYIASERAVAKRALQQSKPDDMMQAIRYVYRLTDELAESGSLELRKVAAITRLQMLEHVQSLLLHPLCRHEHHEILHKLFDDQINNRVTDTTIWTRYHDEGKKFFEDAPRQGLDKMVSPKLRKELADKPAFSEYEKSPVERFSHDQSVFRRVSEVIVESCSEPYFQRQPELRTLDKELREQQGTTTEPLFAVLLLRDVSETMRLFAQERSGIEMAHLALSVSLKGQSRNKTLNFLTGNEYEIVLITDGIMCTYKGNIKPFYVPYR